MSLLIKGMEMPQTGLYFVSVDNTNGRDKTVVTVERMLGNRDVRLIVGSFELAPVPSHGRLINADALEVHDGWMNEERELNVQQTHITFVYSNDIANAPTIIPAEEGDT